MHLEKADFLEEFAALFKIGLRLAGEAADAVGGKADRARTVGGAQLVHHLCILLGSVNAAHPAQGGSATALQAQVELRAELFHGGKAGDELRREHIRVQTAQTDALDALHLSAVLHQLHKVGTGIQTIAGQGDGTEHHLAVAGSRQLAQFGKDAGFVAAAHRAAGPGDDAVGALAVAAVLYLDKGTGVGLEPLHGQLFKFFAALVGRDGHNALMAVQQLENVI